ncbi:MAG: AAC(3) family N-acetyltransferase [Crocinitomicaceae bacterium]
MSLKDFIRKCTPEFALNWNRKRKKAARNSALENQKLEGKSISKDQMLQNLKEIGIQKGDVLLVHSSLSRIGFLENGASTFIEALIEAVGPDGTLLMPTSPNNVYQLNYIRNTPFFDVLNSPSKTGKITEVFRTWPGSKRSLHPTEPVSALGKNADYFIKDHFNQLTPYNEKSPFYKVSEQKGKILYVGVTLAMAGTNLHTLEDAVEFKYPVYYPETFEFEVLDESGKRLKVKTKVHDPEWSKKRKCDDLIPLFESKGVLEKVKIGEAETLLVDAAGFLSVMIEEYEKNGVTMYTPKGS